MNGWILLPCLALATSLTLTSHASVPIEEIHADQKSVFVKESTNLIVSARVHPSNLPKARLSVVRIDESGQVLQLMGIATDDGVMGDKKAGDGIYTRKIIVYAKKPGTFLYAFAEENPDGTLPKKIETPQNHLAIEILQHPTLMGALKEVWKKL